MMSLLCIFLIIFAIQVAFFVFAATLKTDKVTDLAYGLTFVIITLWLYVLSSQEVVHLMLFAMIGLRWIRLAGYLFVRILHMGTDRRFDDKRDSWIDFAKFWLLQTGVIFILLLPVIFVMRSVDISLNWTHRAWWIVFLLWFVLESVADQQKWRFKKANPKQHCMVWLRSKARHPNYFWEILVWVGIFIFASSSLVWWKYIAIVSPLSIYLLLRYVSGVPLLIKQWDKRYGNSSQYQVWKEETRMFVPR